MRSAYSTTKVLFLFLFLLVLVEATLCVPLEKEDDSSDEAERLKHILEASSRGILFWRRQKRHIKDFRYRVKSNNLAPRVGPQGIVDIKWEDRNDSDGSYSANVTISNYFKDQDIIMPWSLAWIWGRKESLLRTLAVEGTQQGFVSFGDNDSTYCFNNVTFDSCIRGMIPLALRKTDLSESETSFQITVSHSSRGDHAQPDVIGLEYECECDSLRRVTNTPDYLNTWRMTCIIAKANYFLEIAEKEEL